MVFIVCILHLANALGPVRFRRCNTDLGPSLGYQNRQRVIPRRGELGTRPMVEIDVAIAARQLQALIKEVLREDAGADVLCGIPCSAHISR